LTIVSYTTLSSFTHTVIFSLFVLFFKMPTTSRLVLFTNQILRIGLLSGFELCLHICENGNVCGTPFYHRQSKEDGCLAAVQGKCPRHRSPKNVSLVKYFVRLSPYAV
jgi:hypothetical protein